MAEFLNNDIPLNEEDERYEQYLREARGKIDPNRISDDPDGSIYWFFACLHADCRNHDLAEIPIDHDDELRVAAEAQAICEVISRRDTNFFAIA